MKSKKTPATYHQEKKSSEQRRGAKHDALMKDAKAAFDQMIEAAKAARTGGRPKGSKSKKG